MTCQVCGGKGYIIVDDLHVKQCICAYARDLKEHLGKAIALAETIDESPLYVPGEEDLTDECLFIRGRWAAVTPHLKWVLTHKGLSFTFRIVTDERIKNVFVGAEAYVAKSRALRDATESNNSLMDFIGDSYQLVIIRLGFLGYRNVAAPGALLEALRLRENIGMPTWLIEDPGSIWTDGNRSYNEEVGRYVAENFRTIQLGTPTEEPQQVRPDRELEDDITIDDDLDGDEDMPVKNLAPSNMAFPEDLAPGDNYKSKRRGFRRRKKKDTLEDMLK